MATYTQRINSRSPFYLTRLSGTYILTAKCKVWIWSGHETTDKPASPTYTIDKNALTATSTEIVFEISQLIRDEFNHDRDAYDDTLSTFKDTLWVEIELTSTDSGSAPATISNIYLAVDGYGYFADGVNYAGTIAFTNVLNVPLGMPIKLGVWVGRNASEELDEIKYLNGTEVVSEQELSTPFDSLYSYDKNQYLTFIQNVTETFEARVLADSGTYQINTCFDSFASAEDTTIDSIIIADGSALETTILVNNISECKYTYNTIKFYDRNGLLQQIYMYKVSKENIVIKKDDYNSILGSVESGAYTYSTEKHQVKDYNVTAVESITLNSGFVGEEQNDVFRQILLSEFVWIDDKPASVKTNSFSYKKHVNDRLINYSLAFNYSNNVINNIY